MVKYKIALLVFLFRSTTGLFLDQLMSGCHGLPFCDQLTGRTPSSGVSGINTFSKGQDQNNIADSNTMAVEFTKGRQQKTQNQFFQNQQSMMDGSLAKQNQGSPANSFMTLTPGSTNVGISSNTDYMNIGKQITASSVSTYGSREGNGIRPEMTQKYNNAFTNYQGSNPILNGFGKGNGANGIASNVRPDNSNTNSKFTSGQNYIGGTGTFTGQQGGGSPFSPGGNFGSNSLSGGRQYTNGIGSKMGIKNSMSNAFDNGPSLQTGHISTQTGSNKGTANSPFSTIMNSVSGGASLNTGQGSGTNGRMPSGSSSSYVNPMINGGGNGMANQLSAPGMSMGMGPSQTSGNAMSTSGGKQQNKDLAIVFGNTEGIQYANGKVVIPEKWAIQLLSDLQERQRQSVKIQLQKEQATVTSGQECKPIDPQCPKTCMEFDKTGCTICNCGMLPCPKFPDDCPRGKSKIDENGCPVCLSDDLDWYKRIWSK